MSTRFDDFLDEQLKDPEIFKNLKIKTKVKSSNLVLEFNNISQVEEFIARLK